MTPTLTTDHYCKEITKLIQEIGEGVQANTLAYVAVAIGDEIPDKIWDVFLDAKDHGVEFDTTGNATTYAGLDVYVFALFSSTLN